MYLKKESLDTFSHHGLFFLIQPPFIQRSSTIIGWVLFSYKIFQSLQNILLAPQHDVHCTIPSTVFSVSAGQASSLSFHCIFPCTLCRPFAQVSAPLAPSMCFILSSTWKSTHSSGLNTNASILLIQALK